LHLVGGQRNIERAEIFLQALDALGAGNREHVGALREQPGETELRDGAALVGGDRLDAFDERAVLLKILALETRVALPRVALGKVREIGDDAGEEAAAQWRVSDKRDAEIPGRFARFLSF